MLDIRGAHQTKLRLDIDSAFVRLTAGVDYNNIRYRLKPSEIAKFSRILNDSSLEWV